MIRQKHSMLIAESLPDADFVAITGDHFIAKKEYEKFNETVIIYLT